MEPSKSLSNLSESLPLINDKFVEFLLKDENNYQHEYLPAENGDFHFGDSEQFIGDILEHEHTQMHNGTMHNMQLLNQTVLPSDFTIPTNEEFGGKYNFEIKLQTNQTSKLTWMYSHVVNKVYINMGNVLPIDFKWNPTISGLYVRATPLFASSQHSHVPVVRCYNHSISSDVSNKDVHESIHRHVIRCDHTLASYVSQHDRLSVVVPLGQPQAGTDVVRLTFKFMCKNSCPSGMNRKPLEVIYTLETADGEILGRRKHGVRICSCPKRDKDKDEEEYNCGSKKRRKKPMSIQTSKVIKEQALDDTVYELPLKIVGKNNAIIVLKAAKGLMAGTGVDHNSLHVFKKYMDDIDKQISELESEHK